MISTRIGNLAAAVGGVAATFALGDVAIGAVLLHHTHADLIGSIAFWTLVPAVIVNFACIPWMLVEHYLQRRKAQHLLGGLIGRQTMALATGLQFYGMQFPADPDVSDVFGWRCWVWSIDERCLYSPIQRTPWDGPELRAAYWSTDTAVRGHAGVHAHLVPKDWANLNCPEHPWVYGETIGWCRSDGSPLRGVMIDGIVERFDRFVLGESGWRAEWAIIRKLRAPNTEIGLALEQAFPDVEIVYGPDPETIRYEANITFS